MKNHIITYNYSIPAYGLTKLIEPAAKKLADRLFTPQGKWDIKSSDIFVTLFFSDRADADNFKVAWLFQTIALPLSHMSNDLRLSAQVHVGSTGTPQGTVLPNVPMGPLTEYLRLGPKGSMGWNKTYRSEVYAPGKLRNRCRTDLRSEFTSSLETGWGRNFHWNAARVLHEGSPRLMLWTGDSCNGRPNLPANHLLRNQFVQGSGLLSSGDSAFGDVYFVLNQTWRPFTDIPREETLMPRALEFAVEARPYFTGWWHALSISNGWRIFSDNLTEMTYAKLALSQ